MKTDWTNERTMLLINTLIHKANDGIWLTTEELGEIIRAHREGDTPTNPDVNKRIDAISKKEIFTSLIKSTTYKSDRGISYPTRKFTAEVAVVVAAFFEQDLVPALMHRIMELEGKLDDISLAVASGDTIGATTLTADWLAERIGLIQTIEAGNVAIDELRNALQTQISKTREENRISLIRQGKADQWQSELQKASYKIAKLTASRSVDHAKIFHSKTIGETLTRIMQDAYREHRGAIAMTIVYKARAQINPGHGCKMVKVGVTYARNFANRKETHRRELNRHNCGLMEMESMGTHPRRVAMAIEAAVQFQLGLPRTGGVSIVPGWKTEAVMGRELRDVQNAYDFAIDVIRDRNPAWLEAEA